MFGDRLCLHSGPDSRCKRTAHPVAAWHCTKTCEHVPWAPTSLQALTRLTSLSLQGNRISTLPEGRYLTGEAWLALLHCSPFAPEPLVRVSRPIALALAAELLAPESVPCLGPVGAISPVFAVVLLCAV